MTRRTLCFAFAGIIAAAVRADEAGALTNPAHRIAPDDPAWNDLAGELRKQPSVTADFTERRLFSFKKTPKVLRGEVRVSADRGLSLHYVDPEDNIVVIDGLGVLLRSAAGDSVPPADPRAGAANTALLHALRLDLGPLAEAFELYGLRAGAAWTLALVPRAADLRRTLGQITVGGEGAAVRRIEFRRSATQRVEISVAPPRATASFTAEELRRYFR
jgi:hypothetical protein